MIFTIEKPTKEGWYWFSGTAPAEFRLPVADGLCVLELKMIAEQMTAFPIHDGESWTLVEIDTFRGKWAGPLEPPER